MTTSVGTYHEVLARVATLCNLDIYTAHHGRTRQCSRARYIAWYVLATHMGWSHRQISLHTKQSRLTVRYGVEQIGSCKARSEEGAIVLAVLDALRC
jgi:hypothetical protein